MSVRKPPSTVVLALVTNWPPDGDWLTEEELATDLDPSVGVTDTADGLMLRDRPLGSVLNEARRRSWLIRDRRTGVCLWQRTPTGAAVTT